MHTWTRTDGIHTNAFPDDLIGQPTSEGDDCSFGRGVIEKIRTADVCVDRSVIDDRVTARHMREDIFRQPKQGMDICDEGLFPLFSVPKKSTSLTNPQNKKKQNKTYSEIS